MAGAARRKPDAMSDAATVVADLGGFASAPYVAAIRAYI